MSILESAQSGDRRAALEAMRDKLAADMDNAPPAVVAQIAGRLQAVLADLDGMATPGEVSTVDELKRRRQDRLAKAAGDEPAAKRTRQRRKRSD